MTQLQHRFIQLISDPGKVFKIDFTGAVVSMIFFCAVMLPLHDFFGISMQTVTEIGIFTLSVSLISFCCLRYARNNHPITGLSVLIAANVSYCIFTAVVMITHRNQISAPGMLYLNCEIPVILMIATMELTCLRRCINNRTR